MRLLADENFDNRILDGVRRIVPDVDIIRVQDTDLYQAPDPKVLELAARDGRILLTHDIRTMVKYAYERVKAGLPMPGVIEVAGDMPIGQAAEELAVMIVAGTPADFENQIKYLPLQ